MVSTNLEVDPMPDKSAERQQDLPMRFMEVRGEQY
jgi:hypothetical protein